MGLFRKKPAHKYTFRFNRRTYNRFRLDALASMIVSDNIEKPMIVRDLCSRGAGIEANFPIPVDQEVTIALIAPIFEKPLSRKGKVIWCRQIDKDCWHIGLDFGLTNLIEF